MSVAASDRIAARLGVAVLLAVAVFAALGASLQFVRDDLDWVRAPMSAYLRGPHGAWLVAAYQALAVGLVLLGIAWYRALVPLARSGAPVVLFALGGIGLSITALTETDSSNVAPALAMYVHGIAAQTAFLGTTTAMLLQSWRLRFDPRWQRDFAWAFSLASVSFVALWTHALWRSAPRGLSQKVVIALIVAWLALAAWRLVASRQRVPGGGSF